ncbi:glucose-1-phosphate thymidylyltransferase [Natronoarchaeum philippinense]|uniref:Bifunctional protein GlmU n=1 Tax=Natronoarchaeum philippinense TaxID=558529 RepID=A0A285P0G3_NATPI|nr:sugar phosphate nucleotidyltransferase [Natronoarchaeum philippinense]SNZ15220.1 glucose-1-phosphate thymidylyltransferase [Natronoarchaeum philippinense]
MTAPTAVVLAAGEGVRLRPLTRNRPKPLLPAGSSPILEHALDTLTSVGVDDIVLVVGHKRSRVQDYVGSTHDGATVRYVTQDSQLGSGHALLQAESAVDGPLLVLNGDQVIDSAIVRDVLDAHRDAGDAAATVGALDRGGLSRYGGVVVDDGRATEFAENPDDEAKYRLNAGVYGLEQSIFDALRSTGPENGDLPLTSGLQTLVDRDENVAAVRTEGLWADANYPWDVLGLARELFDHGVLPGADDPAMGIAPSARVHDDAVLKSPVVVAEDAVVEAGAVLGPHVCVGQNATVGANTVLENTVLDADARVGANATLADCMLGQGARLGPGTIAAGGPADVRIDERVLTDQRLGAVVADRAELGGGVTIAPGTLIGPEAQVGAGVTLDANVPADAEVRR